MNILKYLLALCIIATTIIGYIWFGYTCFIYNEVGFFLLLYVFPGTLVIICIIVSIFEWTFKTLGLQ